MIKSLVFLAILNLFNGIHAWGGVGHQLTGALATKMLTADAQKNLESFLLSDETLGDLANWADQVKNTDEYSYTKEMHYIDAKDNPPSECNIDYERDCPDGNCVVGGIARFSNQVATCTNNVGDRADAAKFIVHFIGDLAQPLHTCERARGGNDVSVKFGKKKSRLHAVWDGDMITKRLKEDFKGSFNKYLDYLYTRSAQLNDPNLSACLDNVDYTNAEAMKDCVMSWSADSNAINCKAVWPAFDRDSSQDFSGDYYRDAIPIVENQIIKSGLRIAKFFNNLKGCSDETKSP